MQHGTRSGIHITILLVIAMVVGIYLVATTTLIASDGASFIKYAKDLRVNPNATITRMDQPPGYPFLLLIVHILVGLVHKSTSLFSWIYSAQGTALGSRLLTVVVLYFIGVKLVGRRSSFLAVLILILLPKPAEYGSDALSDWPHLFFLSVGLILLMRAVSGRGWWWFGPVGLVSGLGYLIRPECAQLVACGGLWAAAQLVVPQAVMNRKKAVGAMVLLLVGFLVVSAPYMRFKGAVFPKKGLGRFSLLEQSVTSDHTTAPKTDNTQTHQKSLHLAGGVAPRIASSLGRVGNTLGNTLMWFFFPALIIGNYLYFRRRFRERPVKLLLGIFIVTNVATLAWLCCSSGYLSKRHTMPLIIYTIFHVPAGVRAVAKWCQKLRDRTPERFRLPFGNVRFWSVTAYVIGIAILIPPLLIPIRIEGQGCRTAAAWIKRNTTPDDVIVLLEHRISFYAEREALLGFREPYFSHAKYVVQVIKPFQDVLPYKQLRQVQSWPVYGKRDRGTIVVYRIEFPTAGILAGPWQLFVDDYLIEEKSNVVRTYHPFKKYAGNPVLVADKPWEGTVPYVYGTVLPDEGGGYRMWYHSYVGGNDYLNLYATSADGITWIKPDLNIVPYKGSKRNNIFFRRTRSDHLPQVIHTPWEKNPNRRYKLIYYHYANTPPENLPGGYYGAYSFDGIHWYWGDLKNNPIVPDDTGDMGNFVWAPRGKRYIGYPKKFATVRGHRRQCVGFTATKDFEHWPPTKLILTPDRFDDRWTTQDKQHTDFYGLSAFPYETMYIGFLWVFRITNGENNGPIFVELISSRNGVDWVRQEGNRPPILPVGPAGAWDSGMVFTTNHPLVVGDKIKLWYGGFKGQHGSALKEMRSGIGLAYLRKDAFASLDAGAEIGTVTTKPFINVHGILYLNAAPTKGGWIKVELVDANGNVLPGYHRNDCDAVTTDGVRLHVTWGKQKELPVSDEPVRIRFVMANASLYSFMPGEGAEVVSSPRF